MKTRLMQSRPLKKTESISPLSVLTLLSEILENMFLAIGLTSVYFQFSFLVVGKPAFWKISNADWRSSANQSF